MSGDPMPEIEGAACCILEICCGGTEQIEALAAKIEAELPANKHLATQFAQWIVMHYDLAPAGTLRAFKKVIAELARKYPPNPGY